MKPGLSSGGKAGKIIFVSGVVFSLILGIIGMMAAKANHIIITPID